MAPLVFLAPLWFAFEVWQLVLGERHLGVKVIQERIDPRATGPSELTSFFWSGGILLYWFWMVLMLYQDIGRAQMIAMLLVTLAGFGFRRSCGLKWVLVTLTLEGAIRIGMLISLCGLAWRRM